MSATAVPPPNAELERAWRPWPGLWGFLTAVNHKQIGLRFIVTSFVLFLVGGVQALLLRVQLAQPLNDFLGPQSFNELFTMHGTTMMFLFAVPMVEGLAMYFAPLLVGARDLPFPRLNAFGYWVYLFGALLLYSSFLVGQAPDGGWFAYVPLTDREFSPGANLDFWLLGVTFIEISALAAAIEIIVLVLKHRAPGLALHRMPIFVWSVLVVAFIILFAFPPLIAASVMLELDRVAGTAFYTAALGGDPLLWQHLFWFFGHPEVYIIHLPATGVISALVPVFARRALAGYSLVVTSVVAIGILSFGVWVHHMYAVGLPLMSASFFAAASIAIALPSGVQFFAWLVTLWRGRLVLHTPLLFTFGFLFIFLAGGITGVMLAVAPFDWQAHDTYFVVAHFHYVLIGGFLFPLFAGIVFWLPKVCGRLMSEALNKVAFWLMFAGFNAAFFVQHILGFLGMTRRVYTYRPGLGWDGWNLVSTIGAFVLALGILVFVVNAAWSWRRGRPAGDDPWGGGTLEWATASPPPAHNFTVIPRVGSRDPMWEAGHPQDAEAGDVRLALADPVPGHREMLVTSIADAEPEGVTRIPIASIWPLVAAASLAFVFVGVLVSVYALAAGALLATVAAIGVWLWPREEDLRL